MIQDPGIRTGMLYSLYALLFASYLLFTLRNRAVWDGIFSNCHHTHDIWVLPGSWHLFDGVTSNPDICRLAADSVMLKASRASF